MIKNNNDNETINNLLEQLQSNIAKPEAEKIFEQLIPFARKVANKTLIGNYLIKCGFIKDYKRNIVRIAFLKLLCELTRSHYDNQNNMRDNIDLFLRYMTQDHDRRKNTETPLEKLAEMVLVNILDDSNPEKAGSLYNGRTITKNQAKLLELKGNFIIQSKLFLQISSRAFIEDGLTMLSNTTSTHAGLSHSEFSEFLIYLKNIFDNRKDMTQEVALIVARLVMAQHDKNQKNSRDQQEFFSALLTYYQESHNAFILNRNVLFALSSFAVTNKENKRSLTKAGITPQLGGLFSEEVYAALEQYKASDNNESKQAIIAELRTQLSNASFEEITHALFEFRTMTKYDPTWESMFNDIFSIIYLFLSNTLEGIADEALGTIEVLKKTNAPHIHQQKTDQHDKPSWHLEAMNHPEFINRDRSILFLNLIKEFPNLYSQSEINELFNLLKNPRSPFWLQKEIIKIAWSFFKNDALRIRMTQVKEADVIFSTFIVNHIDKQQKALRARSRPDWVPENVASRLKKEVPLYWALALHGDKYAQMQILGTEDTINMTFTNMLSYLSVGYDSTDTDFLDVAPAEARWTDAYTQYKAQCSQPSSLEKDAQKYNRKLALNVLLVLSQTSCPTELFPLIMQYASIPISDQENNQDIERTCTKITASINDVRYFYGTRFPRTSDVMSNLASWISKRKERAKLYPVLVKRALTHFQLSKEEIENVLVKLSDSSENYAIFLKDLLFIKDAKIWNNRPGIIRKFTTVLPDYVNAGISMADFLFHVTVFLKYLRYHPLMSKPDTFIKQIQQTILDEEQIALTIELLSRFNHLFKLSSQKLKAPPFYCCMVIRYMFQSPEPIAFMDRLAGTPLNTATIEAAYAADAETQHADDDTQEDQSSSHFSDNPYALMSAKRSRDNDVQENINKRQCIREQSQETLKTP